jgi:hypothetical protein
MGRVAQRRQVCPQIRVGLGQGQQLARVRCGRSYAEIGSTRAIGRPREVRTTTSPALIRPIASAIRLRRSRTATVVM